jgi:hypothetical protein
MQLQSINTRRLTYTSTSCRICSMSTIKKQRVTLFLDPKLIKHAKTQAVLADTTLTDLVETALIKTLPEEIDQY